MSDTRREQKISELLQRLAEYARTEPSTAGRVVALPPQPGRRWMTGLVAAVALAVVLAGTALVLRGHSDDRVIRSADQVPVLQGGTTELLTASGLASRTGEASVWTGKEVLVWGGSAPGPAGTTALADGAALDPSSNRWRPIPPAPIAGRSDAAVAWTGREMIVALGLDAKGARLLDGAAFDPQTDRWRSIASQPFGGALRPATVWTGTEMLVVATANGGAATTAYNPVTDRWRGLSAPPGSLTMPFPQVVWKGSEAVFVLWGSPPSREVSGGPVATEVAGGPVGTLAASGTTAVAPSTIPALTTPVTSIRSSLPPPPLLPVQAPAVRGPNSDMFLATYSPATDRWTQLPDVALRDGSVPRLVWTGREVLALQNGQPGAAFDPARQSWQPIPAVPSAGSGFAADAVWTGRLVLLWSGGTTGLAYDPEAATWWSFDAGGLPVTDEPVVAWADGVLIGWGGLPIDQANGRQPISSGIRYRPPRR